MIESEPSGALLDEGELAFTIESRILRELGERLVKQPEVALVELIKNAYDADARECTVTFGDDAIKIEDSGVGMTLEQFVAGWMRIGTSAKENERHSKIYRRDITGEKGIGRFAVRFLGRKLDLMSVAFDPKKQGVTRLHATFDWPEIDRIEDLGEVRVPYTLERVADDEPTGITLIVSDLRPGAITIDMQRVRTGSIGILTPLRSLIEAAPLAAEIRGSEQVQDPGFTLKIQPAHTDDTAEGDVGTEVLNAFALRAVVNLRDNKITISIFRSGDEPYLEVTDTYPNEIGRAWADLRFLPYRKGVFTGLNVDGRRARGWIVDNSGIAVFDRAFRVYPYGSPSDDWLQLSADNARNFRDPRSTIARKHYPMEASVRSSTSENYMLRLPQPTQMVGVVQVAGRRSQDQTDSEGLVASADREGFVENAAFAQLKDIIRAATELIAFADRAIQRDQEEADRKAKLKLLRVETRDAIHAIESSVTIPVSEKNKIVTALVQTERLAKEHDENTQERVRQLEVMSLLGVVAGFMTHEFGVALHELKETQLKLIELSTVDKNFAAVADSFAGHISKLEEFVTYSQAYIRGSRATPTKPYKVKPRLQQVARVFGSYAETRGISLEIEAENDLLSPLVPASLYNGLALNLYTNALKAVTAKAGGGARRISFRAWNEGRFHSLEVADTGIGIPDPLRERVFDPLFTTTDSIQDPLGSGMGLGLALVRRCASAFGGSANVVAPPPDFATCVQVRIPLQTGTN